MALGPGTRLGAYEITARLGAGGMGEVYRATDARLKRDVALKVVRTDVAGDPERLARFRREAELLASLNHPHIAHVHGLEEAGGITALIMELVEGEDLSARLARGAMPVREALGVAGQIAGALEAAHEQGIVHRDLKPGNVKIRPDGTVKVLDFGLAKSLAPAGEGQSTVTAISTVGAVVGTPAYMSPEQARGEPAGREADVWAFGVVLYEMLSGVSLFARPSATETLSQVLTAGVDESRLPAAVPGRVRVLIRRCLERDRQRRWRHLGDARLEIDDALSAQADATDAAAREPAGVPRRTVLRDGAAALLLAASGIAGGMWIERARRPALAPSFRRLTFRRGLIRSARFAPDGQTILYGVLWDTERCRVHTLRVDGPESRALDLPDANVLAVSRSGELALALGTHRIGTVTHGTLARVPMAGGAPRPLVEDVKFADWSPDGADLAIVRRVNGLDQLEYPHGTVLIPSRPGEYTGIGFPRVSPDGSRVAFAQFREPGSLRGRVAIVDRSGRTTVLSPEYLNVHGLAWRGDEILFTAADEGPFYRALRATSPAGSLRMVTRVPGNTTLWDAHPDGRLVTAQTDDGGVMMAHVGGNAGERDLSWLDASMLGDLSRDGRWVLFTEYGQGAGNEMAAYLRGTDGGAAVRLGTGRGLALSPDGRWAVCASSSLPSSYLELLPTGAGQPRRLEDTGLAFTGARWLPTGDRLVVSALDQHQRSQVHVLDLVSGRSTALTPAGIGSWAVSPEGSQVAARGPDGVVRVFTIPGGTSRDVPGLTGMEQPVGWITSGLIVTRPGDPASPLGETYRIDLATGRQERWRRILPRDSVGMMNFLGLRTTPDGESYAYGWHRALSSLYLAEGLI